jgi:hypothetical protein
MIPNQVNVFRIILAGHSQYYPTKHQYAKDCVLCEVELNIYITRVSVLKVLTCRGLRPMSNKRRKKNLLHRSNDNRFYLGLILEDDA